ncbi:MAG: 2-hydroxyglutaryl-CoA dehydratase [Chloroflexi bacterium]|nr:2-hydroxyglutaryl-CoA dehydratase [Chloroflexota bacterium]
MIAMGCDVGTSAVKVAIMEDGTIVTHAITPTEGRITQATEKCVNKVLSNVRLSLNDIKYCAGTGWGVRYLSFPHTEESSMRCLARGCCWAVPGARTVLDLGGLSSTAISIDEKGNTLEYRTNDKCASGTGRFLEIAAEALEVKTEDMGALALSAKEKVDITNQCAVFMESELVAHVNEGREVPDIAAGIAYSIGLGLSTLANRLGVRKECVMTGGVAKNKAVVRALEESLGVETKGTEVDPQIIAAIGAALCAQEER